MSAECNGLLPKRVEAEATMDEERRHGKKRASILASNIVLLLSVFEVY